MPEIDNSWTQADTENFLKNHQLSSCPPTSLMDKSYQVSTNSLSNQVSRRESMDKQHRDMVGGATDMYQTTNPACRVGYVPEQYSVSSHAPESVGNSTTNLNQANNTLESMQKDLKAGKDSSSTTGGGKTLRRKKSHRRKRHKSIIRKSRKQKRRKTQHHRRKHSKKHRAQRKKHSRKH